MFPVADSPWLRVLVEYLIKTSLVVSCGLALVRLFHRRTAALRHFVLFLSLAGLPLLPLLSISPAGWETPLLPSESASGSRSPAPVFSPAEAPRLGVSAMEARESRPQSRLAARLEDAGQAVVRGEDASRARLGAEAIPVVWLAVLLLLLSRLTLGLGRAARLTRESEAVDEPAWKVLFARCLTAVRLRRKVRLRSHPDVAVPLTWGVRKPVVLIPAGHRAWTEEQGSAALVHELGHVKRADFLALVLVRLSLAVFWFNPLCWFAMRRLRKEQEKACDELVLRTGLRPSDYAAHLLFFKRAAGLRGLASVAFVGIAGRSPFQDRLASILKTTQIFTEVKMKTKLLLALSIIFVVGTIGLARPTPDAPDASAEAAFDTPAVVAEAALSAETATGPVMAPGQEKKAEAQEREKKEQEKKKKEEEKRVEKGSTFVIETREGKKIPLEITIVQGDETKKLKFDTSVTIKKDAGGDIVIATGDGKEVSLSKDEPFRLEIEGGTLSLVKEGKAFKLEEGGTHVVMMPGEGRTVTYRLVKPDIKVVEVKKGDEAAARGVLMIGEKTKPGLAWTVREDLAGIREKLRAVREKLKKAKEEKLDLQEVEAALADLEADLAADAKQREVSLEFDAEPHVYTIVMDADKDADKGWVARVAKGEKKDTIAVTVKDKSGSFSLVYAALVGEKKRETYDRIVERVKKELPEGATLDPSFEEDTGNVTLKVGGSSDKRATEELVKKLGAIIREEIERAKK